MQLIECSGSPYQMGTMQGEQCKKIIQESEKFLNNNPFIKQLLHDIIKPNLLIQSLKKIAGMTAFPTLYKEREVYDRLKGIADGAGVALELISFCQIMEILLNQPLYSIGACTTLGITDKFYIHRGPVVLKNFDYIKGFEKFIILRRSEPGRGYKSIELTFAQMGGCHTGMNEKGLCISYNYGLSREGIKLKLPYTLIFQKCLEKFDNTSDVINFLLDQKFSHSCIVTVADLANNIKVIELSPEHKAIREIVDGRYTVATNFFITPKMQEYDLPHDAFYSQLLPKEIRGIRIHRSNEIRYNQALEMIRKRKKVSLRYLFSVLKDHTPGTDGDDDSICRHSDFFNTQASMVMLPAYKTVYVSIGNPCKTKYKKFKIK